ncbi:MAG TPA: substrate-binding domain-containing protein [Vicinamibacterales bacterium]
MRPLPSALFCSCLLAAVVACSGRPGDIVLAAPPGLHLSGFTDFVVPAFEAESGVRVTVVPTYAMFDGPEGGVADVVIGHDPEAEQQAINAGLVGYYRKAMFNRFLLVGPEDDPAGVRDAPSVADALSRIARAGAPYISRADGSPTAARQRSLWRLAGVPAPGIETPDGTAAALRLASSRGAYTLTVRSLYERLSGELTLVPLFERDDALLNTYSVSVRKGSPRAAQAFAEWLAEGDGRPLIERFRAGGKAVFSVWPITAPSATPDAIPNY